MQIGHKKIPRGHGWSNTGAAIVSADYGGTKYEGTIRGFNDDTPVGTTLAPRTRRSPGETVNILVRNVAGVNLLPKRLVRWAAGYRGKRVNGYVILPPEGTNGVGEVAGVVDEHWPAAGVPDGEMFWLTVKGHSLVKTTSEGGEFNNFSAGEFMIAATAGASTGGTGGEMRQTDLTGAGTTLAHMMLYAIGKAVSARTTAQSATETLVELDLPDYI